MCVCVRICLLVYVLCVFFVYICLRVCLPHSLWAYSSQSLTLFVFLYHSSAYFWGRVCHWSCGNKLPCLAFPGCWQNLGILYECTASVLSRKVWKGFCCCCFCIYMWVARDTLMCDIWGLINQCIGGDIISQTLTTLTKNKNIHRKFYKMIPWAFIPAFYSYLTPESPYP